MAVGLGGALRQLQAIAVHPIPEKYASKQTVLVLNISKPDAGLAIAFRCVVVSLGGRIPPWVP